MWALGELFVYIIYFLLGLACIAFLTVAITTKRRHKLRNGITGILCGFLLIGFNTCRSKNYAANQLTQVWLYYLSTYPHCDSCILELKENQTYVVTNRGKIIEQSNWHYEVGGDYLIVYLDNDKHQLGYGDYRFDTFKLTYYQ